MINNIVFSVIDDYITPETDLPCEAPQAPSERGVQPVWQSAYQSLIPGEDHIRLAHLYEHKSDKRYFNQHQVHGWQSVMHTQKSVSMLSAK